MSNWRKCVFGCENPKTFFSLPKEGPNRQKWLDFISGRTVQKGQLLFVCDKHFADDCLVNLGLYKCGLSARLILKTGAIPTIKPPDGEPSAGTSEEAKIQTENPGHKLRDVPWVTAPVKSRAVQTNTTSILCKSVSTQLSEGTLKVHHVRSKGVQVTGTAIDICTERQEWFVQSSIRRSLKRRRRLEEEEEEYVEDTDVSDNTFKPWASSTDTSELIEMDHGDLKDSKYIVFESSLKELFDTCPVCLHPCTVQRRRYGTLVSFSQYCLHCLYNRKWQSGPIKGSTPVGDLQLSAAIYFSGGSFTKVKRICKEMNLQIHQFNTFRRHCRSFLEPAVCHKWREDQKPLLETLKIGKIAVSGDLRTDSIGQNAKNGNYTITELQSNKILDMQLVQSSDVGGRKHIEGLRKSLDFLEASGLDVSYIVTDCNPQIGKYLRERNVTQRYNVWHLQKGLSRKLQKVSKQKGCRVIRKWSASVKKHLYWTATSLKSIPEKVTKWISFVHRLGGIKTNHHPLLPQRDHPNRAPRDPKTHIHPGAVALRKVKKILLNKYVVGNVANLSSDYQTSFEAINRAMSRFAPKNVVLKYVAQMCRLYLAGMHHNENVKREQASFKRIKHKKSHATAKPVRTKSTYGYVAELMRLVFTEVFPEPSKFVEQLRTVAPVCV